MDRIPDLDDALQDLSEVVGRRLILLDTGQRVIGYSIHESTQDRDRLWQVLAHSDSWEAPNTAANPFVVEARPGVGDCVFVRLIDRDHRILGHLLVVLGGCARPAGEVLDRLLEAARSTLGVLLTLRTLYGERDLARSRGLTQDLVIGESDQRSAAAQALISEHFLSGSGRYCAVVLGVDPSSTAKHAEQTALAVTSTLNFVAHTSTASVVGTTLPDGSGVLVFPRPVVVPRLTRILERPQVHGVRAGIGPLVEIEDVQRSFDYARLAWRATCFAPQDHPTVLESDQAGLDALLARLPLETLTVQDMPPLVQVVLAAGFAPGTLETLDRYLGEGGDAQRAARVLRIHRSTLYYRLDKVRAAIDGDLSDGHVRRELHTGLRVARLAGLVRW